MGRREENLAQFAAACEAVTYCAGENDENQKFYGGGGGGGGGEGRDAEGQSLE